LLNPEFRDALEMRLPGKARFTGHFLLILLLSGVLGPPIGAYLGAWINPPSAWEGRAPAVYSIGSVLKWGGVFFMFSGVFYTGWLMSAAKKDHASQADEWWNRQS
jgi:hypothetical protein